MALSNSQYDELMRTYEQRQLDNEHALRKRYETACSMIPELPALDNIFARGKENGLPPPRSPRRFRTLHLPTGLRSLMSSARVR